MNNDRDFLSVWATKAQEEPKMADNNVNVGGEEIREDAILEATEQKFEEHNTDDQIIKVEDIEKAAEQAETPEAAPAPTVTS